MGPSAALARTWLRRNVTAVLAVVVLANVVAAVPAAMARRLHPATVLRSE